MRSQQAINNFLDSLVRPEVEILRRHRPVYKVCVYAGVLSGVALALVLALSAGVSLLLTAVTALAAILTALSVAMLTKILTGAEQYTYYHYEIAVLAVVAALLSLGRKPLTPQLDLMVLALGVADTLGRWGCLMAGCCHGRPHDWGVQYGLKHAAVGFDSHLVGIRLFPIQIIESVAMFSTVVVGCVLFLTRPPGSTFAWCIMTYGAVRFCLEFARGDRSRPFLLGFSEGQWTSLIQMCAVVAAEATGRLPLTPWHAFLAPAIIMSAVGVALVRRFGKTGKHGLLHPEHLKEFAEAVEKVSNLAAQRASSPRWNLMPANVHLETTSLGVQISASQLASRTGFVYCYVLSRKDRKMTLDAARTLARLIVMLKRYCGANEVVAGKEGTFHLLIQPK
jgi:prolipoprotein diacylglyceryltransferase